MHFMDQAAGLKMMMRHAMSAGGRKHKRTPSAGGVFDPRGRTRIAAVAGGKGGVGKTCVSVNLGMSLAMAGHDVLLLDADLGLANIDVLLGLQPMYHMGHLLDGHCRLQDLVLEAPHGLKVVPATSGMRRMSQLSSMEHAALIRAFDDYPTPPDFMLIDTAAGLSDSVIQFATAADEVAVVVCDEPASLTDAYALIKVLSRECDVPRFQVVANMVRSAAEGRGLFEKLFRVTQRFLDANLIYMGMVPHDEHLRQAIRHQRAVVDAWPGSRASQAFKHLARAADTWESSIHRQGRIGFFAHNNSATPGASV